MEEKSKIFRQKSLDKISSPDQLDQYIKTTTPSFIILFCSVVIFIIGFSVWAFLGRIKTTGSIGFVVENNLAISYISESNYDTYLSNKTSTYIRDDIVLVIDDYEFKINNISADKKIASSSDSTFLLSSSDIAIGTYYYEIKSYVQIDDGKYLGTIVYESTSPISYIF